MKILACLILCVLTIFTSCKRTNNTEPSNEPIVTKDSTSNSGIVIVGISDDSLAFKNIHIADYSQFSGSYYELIQDRSTSKDTTLLKLKPLDTTQILEFWSFGAKTNYNTRFIASPGDSIIIKIKDEAIKFLGDNSPENNFFIELDPDNNDYANTTYTNDLDLYKTQVKSMYLKRKAFFDQYVEEHNVSEGFKNLVSAELKQEYLYNLISPRSKNIDGINGNANTNLILADLIAQDYDIEKNGIFDMASYLDNIKIEEFQNTNLTANDYFKRNLTQLIRQYFVKSDYLDYTKEKYIAEKEFIQSNLPKEIQNIALTQILSDYHQKGFGNGRIDKDFLKAEITSLKTKELKKSYRTALEEIESDLKQINSQIPTYILEQKLLNTAGDTISLGELVQSKQHLKIIDFWASWCTTCIKEIKETKSFKTRLKENAELEWIYLSIDESKNNWLDQVNRIKEYTSLGNHFMMTPKSNTALSSFFKINYIPRYTLVGTSTNILLSNTPRPSDEFVFEQIIAANKK